MTSAVDLQKEIERLTALLSVEKPGVAVEAKEVEGGPAAKRAKAGEEERG